MKVTKEQSYWLDWTFDKETRKPSKLTKEIQLSKQQKKKAVIK